MNSTMTIHVSDGHQSEIKLEVSPSNTLAEIRKKLIEKGARTEPSSKFMIRGRILSETEPLESQGVKGNSKLRQVALWYN